MAPLNAMQPRRVITDVNGRAIARAGRGHAARGRVGMSKRVRRDPPVPHPAHNAPPLNPPPIQNFNNDNDDSSNNCGMQQEEEDSSSDARSVQNNLQHQQPLMDDDARATMRHRIANISRGTYDDALVRLLKWLFDNHTNSPT